MAGVSVEMNKLYPPPAPPIVYVTMPTSSSLSDVKYKCLYLVAVILDMIETIVGGIAILICLFVISLVQSFFKDFISGQKTTSDVLNSDPTPEDADLSDGILWAIRIVLIIILALYIQIQVWGWRGHRDHNTCAIYAFASFKIMSTLLLLVSLCVFGFKVMTFLNFLIKLASVVISFLFAHEVSKL